MCLPLPPCLHTSRERGGGTPLRSVLGRGMPLPPPSLRRRGGGSAQPQPDTLADNSPPSPGPLRLKISSYHHMDDWGEEGEYRVPSPAPSSPHAKRRREEREQGTDCSRAPDFQGKSARHRSPPGERPRPRGHNRYAAPARPRSPPLWALPIVDPLIHCGLVHPYHEQAEFGGTVLARWTHRSTPTPSPTRFGNRPKSATARALGNQTDRPEHTRTRTIM